MRKLCPHCKEEVRATDGVVKNFANNTVRKPLKKGETLFHGKGCDACDHSGYSGRICINEVLVADDSIREAILQKTSSSELKRLAMKNGMTTMLEDGLEKVRAGVTTLEEVLRVIHE